MLATIAMFALLVVLGGRLVWDEYRFEVTSPGPGRAAMDLYARAAAARRRRHRPRARLSGAGVRARHLPHHDPIEAL